MSPDSQAVLACPICGVDDVKVFDRRERVSLVQNRVYQSSSEARRAPAGALAMTCCQQCGYLWNSAFDPDRKIYDPGYENDQTHSEAFREHLAARACRVIAALPIRNGLSIAEIGCGQGDFLQQLVKIGAGSITNATGFDPAWRGDEWNQSGSLNFVRRYFDKSSARELKAAPAALISRHTIEHVSDPIAFLQTIRAAIDRNQPAQLFLETPCAAWIIENLQFEDFFYEHCSLFTARSLYLAMQRGGFQATRIEHVFGGQYLWAEADPRIPPAPKPPAPRLEIARWEAERAAFIDRWHRKLEKSAADRPVYLWGAGAKGVTFSLLIDEEGGLLAGAVDINPRKQGRFMPVTALEIIAPDQLPSVPISLVVMNPVYLPEIERQVRQLGKRAEILSLA